MRVVCFGDSLTTCGGESGRFSDVLQDRFPDHEILNCGAGGEGFEDAKARLEEDVLSRRPDIVLLEYGANDWWQDERPPSAWVADLKEITQRLQDRGAKVAVLSVFWPYEDEDGTPTEKVYGTDERALVFRALGKQMAAELGCPYVANIQAKIINRRCCWRDSNHPNEMGNRHVADSVEGILAEMLGTEPKPIRKPTIHTTRDMWDEAVALAPSHFAAIDGDRRLTYADADTRIEALAHGIANVVGIETRPRVAVYVPNCLEYFLVYWAVARLGGAIVPINTWLKKDALEGIFANIAPDLLITNSSLDKDVLAAARKAEVQAIYSLKDDESLPSLASLMSSSGAAPRPAIGNDDVSIIMHTSGTTGVPKGAVMRHSDLMFNVMTTINAHQFCPSDIHLVVNPMFHCTALYSSLPTAAYQKSTCVITADTGAEYLMALVAQEQITTFLSIPTIFQRIVSLPDPNEYNTSSLRLMAFAGSVMPVSTIRRLQLYYPEVGLHNFFGLTETTSMTHVLKGDDAEERPDSIGRLLPFVRARIVDEQFQKLPPGEVGELLFARDNVIDTYHNQAERLQRSIIRTDDGEWFRTGDLAAVDEDGFYFIKGRAKDMIIVGGENVFAAEVEAVLMSHDMVREAAVKGIPATGIREVLGEMIRAYVVSHDRGLTETDVRRHCFERLESYKIPHDIRFVDDLPRNPSGKIMKDCLID